MIVTSPWVAERRRNSNQLGGHPGGRETGLLAANVPPRERSDFCVSSVSAPPPVLKSPMCPGGYALTVGSEFASAVRQRLRRHRGAGLPLTQTPTNSREVASAAIL